MKPQTSKLIRLIAAMVMLTASTLARADVISDWNNTAILVIKAVTPNPLPGSRAPAMMHAAQFDAVNGVVRTYTPYAADLSTPGASPEAGAAQAAYRVLTNLYPTQLTLLNSALRNFLAAVPDGQPKTDGLTLGNAAAATILALRAKDGSTNSLPYTPGSGPGVWTNTPPALDSALWATDFNEIKPIGETNSVTRTAAQTDTALFHIEFVPYTLGRAARYAVATNPIPLIESARLFALLNMTMADALVSVWDAKFTYNFWRPVTAIRATDTDGNPATDPHPAWTPLRATPPHPEYPAAHTILAAAGAEVLASVFGEVFSFTIESPTLPRQPRTFACFSDFPTESSNARVWAGFHFRHSTEVAAQMGTAIGRQTLTNYLRSNLPPTFTKITNDPVVMDIDSFWNGSWGDYDNDGFLDLYVTQNSAVKTVKNFLYHNNGDGTFAKIGQGSLVNDLGHSMGCPWGDINNDGFSDLFVTRGWPTDTTNCLYVNNGNSNAWLTLKLVGTASNRAAIGAKVRVRAFYRGAIRWQLREIAGGSGYAAFNDLRASFGLGDATNADLVRIEWPSGTVQELHNVATNQFLTITEPPRLEAAGLQPDGSFQLLLTGASGLRYALETSSNLAAWTFWQNVTNTTRAISITDSNAPGFTQRFYRAVGL